MLHSTPVTAAYLVSPCFSCAHCLGQGRTADDNALPWTPSFKMADRLPLSPTQHDSYKTSSSSPDMPAPRIEDLISPAAWSLVSPIISPQLRSSEAPT